MVATTVCLSVNGIYLWWLLRRLTRICYNKVMHVFVSDTTTDVVCTDILLNRLDLTHLYRLWNFC